MQIAFLFADALCGTKALRKRSRELSAEETHEVQYTTKCCRRKAPHPEPTSKSGTESLEIALVRCQLALTPLDFPGVFNHHAHASKRSVRLEPNSEYGESPSLWIRKTITQPINSTIDQSPYIANYVSRYNPFGYRRPSISHQKSILPSSVSLPHYEEPVSRGPDNQTREENTDVFILLD